MECSVDGCCRKAVSKHMCAAHYKRLCRHGDVGCAEIYKPGIAKQRPSEHYSYNAMKIRCLYKQHKQYKDYGGRGIKICERWLGQFGFKHFLEDMGPRPDGCTLDRIDVDGDYEPSNCRWATKKEQSANHRPRTTVKYDGVRYTIPELAQKNNIPAYVLYNRIMKYRWTINRAVTTPVRKYKR